MPVNDGGSLTTSPQGRAFIQRWELNDKDGQPYFDITPDDLSNPTFGYGHKVQPGERAALMAQIGGLDRNGRAGLIDQIFSNDLASAERRVMNRLGPDATKTLKQHQFDALVADAFNAGGGGALGPQMLQGIRKGEMDAAGRQFNAYWGTDRSTGQKRILGGLVRRSLEQAAIFNRGDYGYVPSDADQTAAKQVAIAASVRRRSRRP